MTFSLYAGDSECFRWFFFRTAEQQQQQLHHSVYTLQTLKWQSSIWCTYFMCGSMFIAIFPLEFATVTQNATSKRMKVEYSNKRHNEKKRIIVCNVKREKKKTNFEMQCKDRDVSSFWQFQMFFFPFYIKMRANEKREFPSEPKKKCSFPNIDSM